MPLVAAAAVAAGAALQSATGFGFSVVAAPLVFAAVGPEEAVGLLLVLGTEVNVLTLATERRRSRRVSPGSTLPAARSRSIGHCRPASPRGSRSSFSREKRPRSSRSARFSGCGSISRFLRSW